MNNIGTFPYVAEQSKLDRVQSGFKRLELGMRKDEVKRTAGEPDSEFLSYRLKQENREFIYSTWSYYVKRFERRLSNEGFDQVIVLYFKANDELYWAEPRNIAVLKAVGGPDLYPEAMIAIEKREEQSPTKSPTAN